MDEVWIYVLEDPRRKLDEPERYFYVGIAKDPLSRVGEHLAQEKGHPEKRAIIRDIWDTHRLLPVMTPKVLVDRAEARKYEVEWTKYYFGINPKLTGDIADGLRGLRKSLPSSINRDVEFETWLYQEIKDQNVPSWGRPFRYSPIIRRLTRIGYWYFRSLGYNKSSAARQLEPHLPYKNRSIRQIGDNVIYEEVNNGPTSLTEFLEFYEIWGLTPA